jgi:hypothetical protein
MTVSRIAAAIPIPALCKRRICLSPIPVVSIKLENAASLGNHPTGTHICEYKQPGPAREVIRKKQSQINEGNAKNRRLAESKRQETGKNKQNYPFGAGKPQVAA